MRSIIETVEKSDLERLVKESINMKSVLNKIGLSGRGHSYDYLKKRLLQDKIDYSHFHFVKSTRYTDIREVLVVNSTYTNTPRLKSRLFKAGLLKNVCCLCGQLPSHNGKSLTLQLDHINGEHTDNRIENLRIVCPNCHTQTVTYGSKNN